MEKRKRAPSPAQTRAAAKYNAAHTKQVPLRFNLETDKDILARFEEVGNVQGYIKQLIRADLEKSRK